MGDFAEGQDDSGSQGVPKMLMSKAEYDLIIAGKTKELVVPLEAKFWDKTTLRLFVESDGMLRPKWCSVPDERHMRNYKMSSEEVGMALGEAASWIAGADAVVVGSGAGMGVDSGLGTFRGGKAGVWEGLQEVGLAYEDICQPSWFKKDPRLAWGFWNFCHQAYQEATPHQGYDLVNEWMRAAPFGGFSFTSNIDSHWASSGLDEDRIVEVHGAVRWLQCSEPCCPDVWQAPKDLNLEEDPDTHRVRGFLPACPKCGSVARPAVQMFGRDTAFSRERRKMQVAKYDAWLNKLLSRPGKEKFRLVCVEIGCGLTVPTVRKELEDLMRRFPAAKLIRVNPENPALAEALANRGTSLPLAAGVAIRGLTDRMQRSHEEAIFFLRGERPWEVVEVRAPADATLNKIVQLAKQAPGIDAEAREALDYVSSAEARNVLYPAELQQAMSKQVLAGEAVPDTHMADDYQRGFKVCVLVLQDVRFPKCSQLPEDSVGRRYAQWAEAVLDSLNGAFRDDRFKSKVDSATDKRAILKAISEVHQEVLPQHGLKEEKDVVIMQLRTTLSMLINAEVEKKANESMTLSCASKANQLPKKNSSAEAADSEKLKSDAASADSDSGASSKSTASSRRSQQADGERATSTDTSAGGRRDPVKTGLEKLKAETAMDRRKLADPAGRPLKQPGNAGNHPTFSYEPLILVGSCNKWSCEEAKLRNNLRPIKVNQTYIQTEHHVYLRLDQPVDFQLIGAEKGWDFRIYPADMNNSVLAMDTKVKALVARGKDNGVAHGRNFTVKKQAKRDVEIRVMWNSNTDVWVWCTTQGSSAKTAAPQKPAPQQNVYGVPVTLFKEVAPEKKPPATKASAEGKQQNKEELASVLREYKRQQRQAYGEEPFTTFALDGVLAMLDDLFEGFRQRSFQQQIKEIEEQQKAGTLKRSLASNKLFELRMSVQSKVLPRYGFQNSMAGVMEMMSLIPPGTSKALQNDTGREIQERGFEVGYLAGSDMPAGWKPKRQLVLDEDEEAPKKDNVDLLRKKLAEKAGMGKANGLSITTARSRLGTVIPEPEPESDVHSRCEGPEPESEVSPASSPKTTPGIACRRSQMAFPDVVSAA